MRVGGYYTVSLVKRKGSPMTTLYQLLFALSLAMLATIIIWPAVR